jgi:hypothetical protein
MTATKKNRKTEIQTTEGTAHVDNTSPPAPTSSTRAPRSKARKDVEAEVIAMPTPTQAETETQPAQADAPEKKTSPNAAFMRLLSIYEDNVGTDALATSLGAAVTALGETTARAVLRRMEAGRGAGDPTKFLVAVRAAVATEFGSGVDADGQPTTRKRANADRTGTFSVFGETKDKTLPRVQMPLPTPWTQVGNKVRTVLMSAEGLRALADRLAVGEQVLVMEALKKAPASNGGGEA